MTLYIEEHPFPLLPPGWRAVPSPAARAALGGFPPRAAGSTPSSRSPLQGGDASGTYVTTATCVGKHGERT